MMPPRFPTIHLLVLLFLQISHSLILVRKTSPVYAKLVLGKTHFSVSIVKDLQGHVVPLTQYPVSTLVSVLILAVTLPYISTSQGSVDQWRNGYVLGLSA